MDTEPSVASFRERLRDWIADNLPDKWRDLSHGVSDERLADARRGWGRRLHAAGWAGVRWPVKYGGLGLSFRHQAAAIEEQALAGAPEPMNLNAIEILAPVLLRYGSEELRARCLPSMLSHEAIWCQGFSEPDAGSDLASLATRAVRTDSGWRVNGQKVWTTHGQYAHYCYILVRTDPVAAKHDGISLFILDMDQPGVTVRPLRNLAGSEEFSEIFLDDAYVPPDNVVGEINSGWHMAMGALASERGANMVQRSLRLERELQALRQIVASSTHAPNNATDFYDRLVDCLIRSRAVRSIAMRILEATATGVLMPALASAAKVSWSETHQELLRLGVDAMERSVSDPANADWVQAFLFSRAETVYGGTTEIQRNLMARHLGLPSGR